jgi:AraC-like DNA-binding protein
LGYHSVGPLYSRFPELTHAIVAKYQSYSPDRRKVMDSEELRQALEAVLASDEEPPLSIQEVARSLGYRSETSLYARFPELSHKIVAKYRVYHSNYKQRVSSSELKEALEAVLASSEVPFPSIQEVARRLGYHSKGPLYERFPELAHAIAVRCEDQDSNGRERIRLEELRQALEAVLASDEEPPPSVPEVAQRLGYRSERSLYRRFPELSRAIAERHRKYKFNRQKLMSLEELRQALEAIVASDEEPFPSIQEVAQRLGYRHPTFLYKHFPELSRAISMKKRNREDLQQKLEMFLKDADPAITQQEIAKHFGWSINRLRHHFPELRSILERRLIQSFDIEALQVALEKELTSDSAPQSLSAVARGLGYPVRTLMRFFPVICQKIIVRGQAYRKAHSDLRKQRVQDEVQRAVLIIHGEQRYPSLNQVLKLIDLSRVNPLIFHLEAYIPWKKILEDLGYRK